VLVRSGMQRLEVKCVAYWAEIVRQHEAAIAHFAKANGFQWAMAAYGNMTLNSKFLRS
jgi:hypothetical protein